jgi:hypothetical protein
MNPIIAVNITTDKVATDAITIALESGFVSDLSFHEIEISPLMLFNIAFLLM